MTPPAFLNSRRIYGMEATSVTKQLEIPIIVQEISRRVNSDGPFDDDGLRTGICDSLHIGIDPDSKTWGKTLPGWGGKIVHFRVARQDRQDINFDQLFEIVGYIYALSTLMFKSSTRCARKQILQDFFTEEQFELNIKTEW